MSEKDGEEQVHSALDNGSKERRQFWLGSLVIMVIVLSVVGTVIAAGTLRPSLDDTILKADEMEDVTGVGGWTQFSFSSIKGADRSYPCVSNMLVSGSNTPEMLVIMAWDMENAILASQKYDEMVAAQDFFMNGTRLDIGDECVYNGTFVPEDGEITACNLCFRQGSYCVRMTFVGSLTTYDLCIEVAQAQVSRL